MRRNFVYCYLLFGMSLLGMAAIFFHFYGIRGYEPQPYDPSNPAYVFGVIVLPCLFTLVTLSSANHQFKKSLPIIAYPNFWVIMIAANLALIVYGIFLGADYVFPLGFTYLLIPFFVGEGITVNILVLSVIAFKISLDKLKRAKSSPAK